MAARIPPWALGKGPWASEQINKRAGVGSPGTVFASTSTNFEMFLFLFKIYATFKLMMETGQH